jgi:hypothetical protein
VYSHSDFFVTFPKTTPAARFLDNTEEVDLTARRAYNGQPASGHITIGYSGTTQVLDRPLIVAEGFDPDNDYDYLDFVDDDDNGGLLVRVNDAFNGQTLRDALEADGYDLVFVNYDNGTDYIQNNAYLLQRVIEYVNANKTGSEQNVVLGLSMGGLVGRYALRDMEVNGLGLNHNTRLFVSHDSPHQGANVPLGFQAMVRQLSGYAIGLGLPGLYYNLSLTDISPELGEGVNVLQRPATRQMVKYQLSGIGNFIANDNSMHNAFMTEYSNLGYPQQTQRNIAISSGSECAQPQDIAAYGEFLNINESADFRYWSSLVTSVLGVLTSEPLLSVGNLLTTSSKLKATFIVNALPNQATQRIYKGKLQVKKKVAFLIPVNTTLFDRSFNSSSTMLPLDSSPGGIFDIADFGGAPGDLGLSENVFKNNIRLAFEETAFSFIPTFSSLDIGSGTQTITNTDAARVYSPVAPPTGSKNIPFDNFFTNRIVNENHIQFTLENGNWLLDELRGNIGFYSCAASCASQPVMVVSGPSTVCTLNSTFTLQSPPQGVNVQWTNSSNLTRVSASNSNVVVKASSSTTRGTGWVRATVVGNCGSTFKQFNFWVGPPEQAFNSIAYVQGFFGENPITLSPEGLYFIQVENVPGATSYNWVLPTGFSFLSGYPTNSTLIKVWTAATGGTYQIRCYPQGPCGSSGTGYTSLTVNIPGGGGGPGGDPCPIPPCSTPIPAIVFPNPVTSYFEVSFDLTMEEYSIGYEVRLYSSNQKDLIYRTNSTEPLLRIETTDIKKGIYILQITTSKQVITDRVFIE